MDLISACAKQNRSSKSKCHKVWRALVSCAEEVLASGRGATIEKLGTVTYISRSVREGTWTGHRGCVFVMDPKFARAFSVVQRATPQRSFLAPAVSISSARVGHTAGVDHDYTRVALGAIVDWIGHKVCSGSNLCLPFGRVGTLVGKERTLSFAFADGFRLPKMMAVQDKYDRDVRRILATIEVKGKADPHEPRGGEHTSTARPETSPPRGCGRANEKSTTKHRTQEPHSCRKARNSSRSGSARSETGSEPLPLSARSSVLASHRRHSHRDGHGAEPTSVDTADPVIAGDLRRGTASRPRQRGTRNCQDSMSEEPEAPSPRPMITGAGAVVAGGPRTKRETATAAAAARVDSRAVGNVGDISPGTAKKVLPHFLAIGNPGSQALVAKEGAEIVQRQARRQRARIINRFAKVKAANLLLDEKEVDETKKRQASNTTAGAAYQERGQAKWQAYEERHAEERKRLRDYLAAVKASGLGGQAEAQKAARDEKRSLEFMKDNPDPGRAYPCRVEYDIDKEQAWRKAWCADLEKQVELKQRLEGGIRKAEASRDRVRAAQLDAAIKADRRREMEVKRLDRERINKDWDTQVSSFAHPEGGGRRVQNIILDKIVR
ncbi:unnamed protein product [Ectocarpus fasciculatus]